MKNKTTKKKKKERKGLHLASLAIFWEASWMPNPMQEAFLLNSDLEEAGFGGFGETKELFGWSTAVVVPPIFFRVWDRDRNSAVRSLYGDAIRQMVSDRTVHDGNEFVVREI